MSFKRTVAKIRIRFREYQRERIDKKIKRLGLQSTKMTKEAERLNSEAKAIEQNNAARQAKVEATERLKQAKANAPSGSIFGFIKR